MINIDDLHHKLGKPYQKAGDIKRSYKTKLQTETKHHEIHGNGSKHVTHFVYCT